MILFLSETSRFIVGNGSRRVSGLHRTLVSYLQRPTPCPYTESEKNGLADLGGEPIEKTFRFPNPLTSLRILWAKDSIMITLINGVYYMNFSCLQASMSTLFIKIYGLSNLNAGLIYLPFGVGSCVWAYCSGSHCNFPPYFYIHSFQNTPANPFN